MNPTRQARIALLARSLGHSTSPARNYQDNLAAAIFNNQIQGLLAPVDGELPRLAQPGNETEMEEYLAVAAMYSIRAARIFLIVLAREKLEELEDDSDAASQGKEAAP